MAQLEHSDVGAAAPRDPGVNDHRDEPESPGKGCTGGDEFEEIGVDITEDNMVWIHGEEWELVLSPAEARELAQAITEAAADAEADVDEEEPAQ